MCNRASARIPIVPADEAVSQLKVLMYYDLNVIVTTSFTQQWQDPQGGVFMQDGTAESTHPLDEHPLPHATSFSARTREAYDNEHAYHTTCYNGFRADTYWSVNGVVGTLHSYESKSSGAC